MVYFDKLGVSNELIVSSVGILVVGVVMILWDFLNVEKVLFCQFYVDVCGKVYFFFDV